MIDILLPYYGDPPLMRLAVESVLAQSSPDWRLVVVDDAYPDTSIGSWLQGMFDPRVRYHRNRTNLGISGNFNRALELAEAEFVTFLGCDDELLPQYVETITQAWDRADGASVIQPGVRVIDDQGLPAHTLTDSVKTLLRPRVRGQRLLSGEQLATGLLVGNWTYFPAACWRREALSHKAFRPEFDVVLDLALLMELVMDGDGVLLVEEDCFSYRRHRSSASSRTAVDAHRFSEEKTYFSRVAQALESMGWHRAAKAARLHPTSRLHAAVRVPGSLSRRDGYAPELVRHALGRLTRAQTGVTNMLPGGGLHA